MMFAYSLHILDILFRKCVFWCNGVMNIYTDCDFSHYTAKQTPYVINQVWFNLRQLCKTRKLPGVCGKV